MGESEIEEKLDSTIAEAKTGGHKRGLLSNTTPGDSEISSSSINPGFLVIAGIGEGLNPCGLRNNFV